MLGPYRVIDLTDRRGWFAGMLLAQLGADVVLAEPDGGVLRDRWHEAYNRGKRSTVVRSADDVAALAVDADIVLWSDALPFEVDLGALREANPELITVSLTPFGSDGPKAEWLATDLTLYASSGQMAATGDVDRPPVRTAAPQAWLHASSNAAVGALVALEDRAHTGLGQHVDVSAQQSVCETALPAIMFGSAGIAPITREAGGMWWGETQLRWVYECKDGFSIITVAFGAMIGPMFTRFTEWMVEEGALAPEMAEVDWVDYPLHVQAGEQSPQLIAYVQERISEFALTKTKQELLEAGIERGLLLAPVSDVRDVVESPQLEARDFWDDVEGIKHPGPFVKATKSPLAPLVAAPEFGEHTDELAVEQREPTALPRPGDGNTIRSDRRPLEGITVCDLSWVAAAPLGTKILAYWGATVVRVETSLRPCLTRGALGHRDDIAEQENAITWQSVNANKYGITLNLATEEARQTVRDLIAISDIVIDSFTPGAMARLGFGYDDLVKIKPDIIQMSSCVMGQSGPYKNFAGFGNMAASVAGFFDCTGWPDRRPAGPYMAYTDYTSPRFTAMALLAAVDHRRRTGEGQYLDFSQAEAATHLLTPGLLEFQHSGEILTRKGNISQPGADPVEAIPHALYPCAGEDNWVAVVCETDEQWRSLATEMRRDDLADLTFAERKARVAEIDEIVGAWTAVQDGIGLQTRLQQHGVPAHMMQNTGECLNDPQLAHRGHFQWAPHPIARRAMVDAPAYQLSRSPGGFNWAGPTYGQHTMEVLEDMLGYDGDQIAALAIAEALE